MAHEILVGTSNWADHDPFYPPELQRGKRQKERLTYYARYFPMVEIDTTFYGTPKPQVAAGWVERTPPGFRFNVKPYRSLTRHERNQNKRVRPPTEEEVPDVLEALKPLRESGKLVAVHYQFPGGTTTCPGCGAAVVVRDRCAMRRYLLDDDGACRACGTKIPGRYDGPAGHWGRRRLPVSVARVQR